MSHIENHKIKRIGITRAAVLGANDGIISTSSLILGVAFSGANSDTLFVTAMAGLVAGAMSMAAGEYVSVSSQADIEKAEVLKEKKELLEQPESELKELTGIYLKRGLSLELAKQVAAEFTQKDALKAHLRDELGLVEINRAKPLQAAFSSAVSFTVGALISVSSLFVFDFQNLKIGVVALTLFALFSLGALSSSVGGAPILKGAVRVLFWGVIALLASALIGQIFNVSI